MCGVSACGYVHEWGCYRSQRSQIPGAGVTGGCELQCGCWELNLGPLQKQGVLLTDELSFQPQCFLFLKSFPHKHTHTHTQQEALLVNHPVLDINSGNP